MTIVDCNNTGEYYSDQYRCSDLAGGQNNTGFVTQNRGYLLIKNSHSRSSSNDEYKFWAGRCAWAWIDAAKVYRQAWVNLNYAPTCYVQGGAQLVGVPRGWAGDKGHFESAPSGEVACTCTGTENCS